MHYQIIIIDDDDDELYLARAALTRIGVTKIKLFETRTKALKALTEKAITANIIVFDLQISGDMRAIEFARELRNLDHLEAAKLVCISGIAIEDAPVDYQGLDKLIDAFYNKNLNFTDDRKRWQDIAQRYLLA